MDEMAQPPMGEISEFSAIMVAGDKWGSEERARQLGFKYSVNPACIYFNNFSQIYGRREMTPTGRALLELRKNGWDAWVVESRITTFIKRDLFNCIDILALKDGTTLAIQVTAGSAHAARVKKVVENEYLAAMHLAGWQIEVWSFRKSAAGRWVLRQEVISPMLAGSAQA